MKLAARTAAWMSSLMILGAGVTMAGTSPGTGSGQHAQLSTALEPLYPLPAEPGEAPLAELETFPNSWHASTIGLSHDSVFDTMYYFHEGQAANPETIWEIEIVPPHGTLGSISLSAVNPGFPQSLNDRDGGGFDPAAETFFVADYQGDLSARDDNIVEIDRAGVILNAWETDGASNDSSDGSLINTIIDVTILPGTPPRFFATAAEGTGVLYEIDLQRVGQWVPASWSTVGTCTVAGAGDLIATDYDSEQGVFYGVSFGNETIYVFDPACNVLATYDCNGAGTFHTGVSFAQGSYPRQVWVTDFASNTTTRCEVTIFSDNFETADTSRWSVVFP